MNTKDEVCMTLAMENADAGKRLHNMKRRRARERGNITRFLHGGREIRGYYNTRRLRVLQRQAPRETGSTN